MISVNDGAGVAGVSLPHQSRKLAKIIVSAEDVLQMMHTTNGAVISRWVEELPDLVVVGVCYSQMDRAFIFLVSHESFKEVPNGGIPPYYNGPVGRQRLVVLNPDEEVARAARERGATLFREGMTVTTKDGKGYPMKVKAILPGDRVICGWRESEDGFQEKRFMASDLEQVFPKDK